MSQNTLKVHDLNEDAEFDENGIEVFDEKALVEEEPSDSDLAEEELLSQVFHLNHSVVLPYSVLSDQ